MFLLLTALGNPIINIIATCAIKIGIVLNIGKIHGKLLYLDRQHNNISAFLPITMKRKESCMYKQEE
jgi:hypothetical protein